MPFYDAFDRFLQTGTVLQQHPSNPDHQQHQNTCSESQQYELMLQTSIQKAAHCLGEPLASIAEQIPCTVVRNKFNTRAARGDFSTNFALHASAFLKNKGTVSTLQI